MYDRAPKNPTSLGVSVPWYRKQNAYLKARQLGLSPSMALSLLQQMTQSVENGLFIQAVEEGNSFLDLSESCEILSLLIAGEELNGK